MNHLLLKLIERSTSYIMERVHRESTPTDKLNAFILASLAYQGTHPTRYAALIEIVFNARSPENIPYYRLSDNEDPIMHKLLQILREGQDKGDFGEFHVHVMANMIQGAICEYMLNIAIAKKVDLETYSGGIVKMVNRAIKM
jgi:TetR/AcrR family transcriptional regulator, transcriptional repressor of bet genes